MRWIAGLAIGVLCVAYGRSAHAQPLAQIALVDQRGATFSLQDLRGKPAIVTFIATRCGDVCPIASAVFARLAHEHITASLVTITLDPSYDTPFVTSRYAHDVAATAPQWRVASGRAADVRAVMRALGVAYRSQAAHSTLVYIFDARGRLATALPLSTVTARQVRAWLAGHS